MCMFKGFAPSERDRFMHRLMARGRSFKAAASLADRLLLRALCGPHGRVM